MPIRNFSAIVDDGIKQLAATSNVSQLGRGSKARTMLELMGAEIASQYRVMNNEISEGRISTATSRNLDRIADMFNITRLRRTQASSTISDLNVNFYVPTSVGTFSGLSTLPTISTGSILNTRIEGDITYKITETAGVLNPASSTYFVGVVALQPGSRYNVGKDALVRHGLGITDLLVTNSFPIANGRDDETDDQLRFRAFNAVRSLEAANDRSLFIAARIVPGVGDVKILPHLFGIGTSALLVRPVSGTFPTENIIQGVRTSIADVVPSSSRVVVTGPDITGFELELVVNYSVAMTATDKSNVASKVVSKVTRYFNTLDIGSSVSYTAIASVASSADRRISSLGTTEGTFGRLWIYNSEVPGQLDSRHKREVLLSENITSFSIEEHELAALESSLSSPIVITHGTEG